MPETVHIQLPARINLLGNPADAVEGDYAVLSAAIECYAHARITRHTGFLVQHFSAAPDQGGEMLAEARSGRRAFPLPVSEPLNLQLAALNRMADYSPDFREIAARQGVQIQTWTEVPRGSGLGGSSLLVLLVLAGMREIFRLDPRRHHDYLLAELAQRVEARDLGITCGYADRYVPMFGGLLYIDYREKLQQRPLGQEPLATVERLDNYVPALPLVLATSGVEHDSGEVHSRLRRGYLDEIKQKRAGGPAGPMESAMRQAYENAWRGKYDLLRGDLAAFGQRMQHNHEAVDSMMRYCGIQSGAGRANNFLIESAYRSGAYGAKLTGAGGGGSVFAVVQPGTEERFAQSWWTSAQQAGLKNAQVLVPRISRSGLQVATSEVQ